MSSADSKKNKKVAVTIFVILVFVALLSALMIYSSFMNPFLKNKEMQSNAETLTAHLKNSSSQIYACPKSFGKYISENGREYYNGTVIEGADTESFEVLGDGFEGYAKDKDHVYTCGLIVENVAPADFEYLGYFYSRVGDKIYYKNDVLEQADAATFKSVSKNSGTFTDKDFGYGFEGEFWPLDDFWFIKYNKGGSDLGENYWKYKDAIYYWDSAGGQAEPSMVKIDADVQSFKIIPNKYCIWDKKKNKFDICDRYGKDNSSVFVKWFEIKGADPKSFQLLPDRYAKDANAAFFESHRLEGSSPDTFKIIASMYSKDDRRVYYRENEVSSADPETFKILNNENQIAKDARSYYWRNEIIDPDDYDRFGIGKWVTD